jgi:hypothetical protein
MIGFGLGYGEGVKRCGELVRGEGGNLIRVR